MKLPEDDFPGATACACSEESFFIVRTSVRLSNTFNYDWVSLVALEARTIAILSLPLSLHWSVQKYLSDVAAQRLKNLV